MKKSDLFATALRNLRNRKTRTRLTVIGVVIGTCAIVIMVSIGVGIDKMLTAQFNSNSSLHKITVYGFEEDESKPENEKQKLDDRALGYLAGLEHVKVAVPTVDMSEYAQFSRGKYNLQWGLKAIDVSKMAEMGYTLTEGAFNATDKYAVYAGKSAVKNFADANGNSAKYKYDSDYKLAESEIDLLKDRFTISAVESADEDGNKTASSVVQPVNVAGIIKADNSVDSDSDSAVYIDMALAKELYKQYNIINPGKNNQFEYGNIYLIVDDMSNISAVKDKLAEKGFVSYSDDDDLAYTKKIMMAVQLVLGAIGAISMFVAAFGISNTMVMSVYERTKEIGVMKVLGCELNDIRAMFLYEAGTIGLMGGVIGLIISYILSIGANAVARVVMSSMSSGDDFYICVSSIPPWLALLGILFAVGVGVLAGISPANRSVKVSALTAIHNE